MAMPCCCVPFCTSFGRKKIPGISFHEIPADLTARERWLKVIARKDWTPNTTSNYSVVCSLHFQASDFKENCKTRQLKPGVVPSVFKGYPSYMQKSPPVPRSDAAIRKREQWASSPGAPPTKRAMTSKGKNGTTQSLEADVMVSHTVTDQPGNRCTGDEKPEPTPTSTAGNPTSAAALHIKHCFSTETDKALPTTLIIPRLVTSDQTKNQCTGDESEQVPLSAGNKVVPSAAQYIKLPLGTQGDKAWSATLLVPGIVRNDRPGSEHAGAEGTEPSLPSAASSPVLSATPYIKLPLGTATDKPGLRTYLVPRLVRRDRLGNNSAGDKRAEPGAQSTMRKPVRSAVPYIKRSFGTQTDKTLLTASFIEQKRKRRRERALLARVKMMSEKLERYKNELQRLKKQCHVNAFLEVVSDAEKGDVKATVLLDQVKNLRRKKPQWSVTTVQQCANLRNSSQYAYDYMRRGKLFRLPGRNTLQEYLKKRDRVPEDTVQEVQVVTETSEVSGTEAFVTIEHLYAKH